MIRKPPSKKDFPKEKDRELLEDFIEDLLFEQQPEDEPPVSLTAHELEREESDNATFEPTVSPKPHPPEIAPSEPYADAEHDERLEKVKDLLSRMPGGVQALKVVEQTQEVKIEPRTRVLEQERAKLETPVIDEPQTQTVADTSATETVAVPEPSAKQVKSTEHLETTTTDTSDQFKLDALKRDVTRAREMLGESFQTLIFEVGKLPLAVPLVKLGGIHVYSEEDVTPIFGTPDWFKGLIPSEEGNIMLVDTAKLIMPEKYDGIENELNYKYAILLDDTRWALACSQVKEAKTLQLDDIRWAQKGSRREWFAGMVVQFMCALLEVDSLINLLYREGKKGKKQD